MTQCNTLNVKLSKSQINKLKPGKNWYCGNFKSFIKYDWQFW